MSCDQQWSPRRRGFRTLSLWMATMLHSKKSEVKSRLVLFCVEVTPSPHACVGFSLLLWLLHGKNMFGSALNSCSSMLPPSEAGRVAALSADWLLLARKRRFEQQVGGACVLKNKHGAGLRSIIGICTIYDVMKQNINK